MSRQKIIAAIEAELERAYGKHGSEPWGRHEAYAIIREEVDELWDAIKADEPLARVAAEAVQVAAMVIRFLETGDRYTGQRASFDPPPDCDCPGPKSGYRFAHLRDCPRREAEPFA